ncbi:Intracellular growth attenuator protein igaA [Erwinia sp. E602]|uniref:intracellular growth attenuator family protein n=1 Tax=unclassified Erwinia TaxID=2622719 RepID=UPI0006F7123A|nr:MULTISPECIES: intracellular growth attenuator family protein [unclassified Erwinia]KQN64005.1 Intracellular growth attenuator protein igaA [Erwinia sp. Leaf53]PLV61048.1 Intracellular growth attenuator protein igaA [Erwinia sp. B116]QUG74005.1 Intracellular growth attenuator protein igaA [Erwinia sp. E602]
MSTVVIILAVMLAGFVVAGCLFWFAMRHRPPFAKPLPFISPPNRKLNSTERAAVERYLSALARHRSGTIPSGSSSSPQQLALTSQSNNVYPVTRAITRYGLSTDEPHKWRYYLDEVEVHLPAQWEQFIAEENFVELIKTQSVPLVISLNGHTLDEYRWEPPVLSSALRVSGQNASIRQEERENVELLRVRKESAEEYALNRPDGTREALVIGVALLLFFVALTGPLVLMPWLVLAGVSMVLVSCWFLYRPPASKALRDIHCLRGTPKRWGLFGESNQGQASSISLGIIDLIYPPHWQNYVTQDLGQTTEIDLYLSRHVVRQGRFLSLQDEVRNFPLQRWRKNVVLAAGCLLVLALLMSWVPLSMPWKISLAWIKGTESLQVSQVSELEKAHLRVGDSLRVKGTGMCSVPAIYQGNRNYAFMPFDCSAVYWNNAVPLPLPQSEVIDKATALVDAISQQLHPQTGGDAKLNPQLASAIQKAGMILLDDFSDIVQKTQALCSQEQDCVRLKNALVNLGSAKDWPTLVRRADSGALNGTNVILRPVSADALENLVNTATATFFYRETRRAAEALNSPPPGGFLLISDEGRQLVSQPAPPVSLFDYNAPDQWPALQRLAGMMLHTPFNVSGIVTGITTDANGTRHVVLHSEPDVTTLWRYLGTSLLLLVLLTGFILNTLLALLRIQRNRQRLLAIQQYYDKCFSHSLGDIKAIRP